MRNSASKFNNARVRLAYALAGLTLWAWFAQLAEKALMPYHGVFCMAGKELLQAIPFGQICEIVLANGFENGAILASGHCFTWMASVAHLAHFVWWA